MQIPGSQDEGPFEAEAKTKEFLKYVHYINNFLKSHWKHLLKKTDKMNKTIDRLQTQVIFTEKTLLPVTFMVVLFFYLFF